MTAMQDQLERARKMARTGEAGTISRGAGAGEGEEDGSGHILVRDEEGKPIVLGLALGAPSLRQPKHLDEDEGGPRPPYSSQPTASTSRARPSRPLSNIFQEEEEAPASLGGAGARGPHQTSRASELMHREIEAKASSRPPQPPPPSTALRNTPTHWLASGIVVKVLAPELKAHGYYKQKGVVERLLEDKFVGEICMIESGDVIRVDQEQLETVLPSPGGSVLVVAGEYKGSKGQLVSIDTSKYQALVQLAEGGGRSGGRQVWLEYEECCKCLSQ